MKYISQTPNPSGAYPAPQSNPAPGLLEIPDDLAEQLVAHNGFVKLTVEDGKVTGVEPDTEAWEAWKAEMQAQSPAEETTLETEVLESLVDQEIRISMLENGMTQEVDNNV